MSPPPRPLSFVVTTSLLSASLSLAACDDKGEPTVNPAPEKQPEKAPEPKRVNEGPVEQPTTANPELPPDPVEPPPPPDTKVNPGPEPLLPAEAAEPKNVNTRPDTEIPKSG